MVVTGKEKLSSLRHKLKSEMIERKAGGSVASYAVMFVDGYWRLQVDDVCFFRSRYQSHLDEKNTDKREVKELVMSLIPGINKGPRYAFVNYILTRSVFKDLFLTKSPQAAWQYGVQMDVDADYSQVVAAMIAIRESWEFPHIADTWEFLCKNGVNEHVAWICAHATKKEKDEFFSSYYDAHQAIGSLCTNQARKLLKLGLFDTGQGSLRDGAATYQVFKATRSESLDGKDIRVLVMEDAKEKKRRWGVSYFLDKETFLANVKKIEKELLS